MKKLPSRLLLLSKNFFFRKSYEYRLVFIAFLFAMNIKSQVINYVNNGGFEDCVNCTTQPYNINPKYWTPIDSSSFAFMYCGINPPISNIPYLGNGFQFPRTGEKMMFSSVYCHTNSCSYVQSRGYPRNRLKQNLKANETYCIKFYVNNRNTSSIATDAFAAYFGDNDLDTIAYCSLPLVYLNPQIQNPTGNIVTDTLNWTLITGTFVANGSEKYMVLGNFNSNATTNTVMANPAGLPDVYTDIFYDDVSCIELNLPAFAGNDTSCIPGSTIYIGRARDVGIDEACIWYQLPNITTAIDTAAGVWISPTSTSTYVVRQEICGLVKWDTVVVYQDAVSLKDEGQMMNDVRLYPVPARDYVELITPSPSARMYLIQLFDPVGRMIVEEKISFKEGRAKLKTDDLPSGAYLITISNANHEKVTKKLVIVK